MPFHPARPWALSGAQAWPLPCSPPRFCRVRHAVFLAVLYAQGAVAACGCGSDPIRGVNVSPPIRRHFSWTKPADLPANAWAAAPPRAWTHCLRCFHTNNCCCWFMEKVHGRRARVRLLHACTVKPRNAVTVARIAGCADVSVVVFLSCTPGRSPHACDGALLRLSCVFPAAALQGRRPSNPSASANETT